MQYKQKNISIKNDRKLEFSKVIFENRQQKRDKETTKSIGSLRNITKKQWGVGYLYGLR